MNLSKANIGIVGANGTVGQIFCEHLQNVLPISRAGIEKHELYGLDAVIICAPSGVKFLANNNPEEDYKSVCNLIELLNTLTGPRIILISTIDTLCHRFANEYNGTPLTAYGLNRKFLESETAKLGKTTIVRLGMLLSNKIKKNALYDLKHGVLDHQVHPDSEVQISNLYSAGLLISGLLNLSVEEINFFSEPIKWSSVQNLCTKLSVDDNKIGVTHEIKYNAKTSVDLKFKNISMSVGDMTGERMCLRRAKEYLNG